MKRYTKLSAVLAFGILTALMGMAAPTGFAAYHHMGEDDSDYFLKAYPEATATKLDSCTLCHSGGSYTSGSRTVTLGSCQWCHYTYGYDASGDIDDTLNPYGMDYQKAGSDTAAALAIQNEDSDGDGYTNAEEIAALRFPGDPADDPTKVPAPAAVYDLGDIQSMPAHTQFMLMNTHKSGDFYVEYTGVPMEHLLDAAGVLASATGIDVYAPDGFSTFHPLDAMDGFYHVRGTYPATVFYYDEEADKAVTDYGWCDYSAPSAAGWKNGDPIDHLKMLLAYQREGVDLEPGELNDSNKLDGEGPFRVVPAQWRPGPPDQSSTSKIQGVIWPFDEDEEYTDHNAGFSTKSATIVRVGPLPEGTTDIDTMEAGWEYVDTGKIVVYGAIDPIPTVLKKLMELKAFVLTLGPSSLRGPNLNQSLARKIEALIHQIENGALTGASAKIAGDLLPKVDGFATLKYADSTDWVLDPTAQLRIYWSLKDLQVLLAIPS